MISPSNLPSPAGYSFGSYEPLPASKPLETDNDDKYSPASILRSSPVDIPVAHPKGLHDQAKSHSAIAAISAVVSANSGSGSGPVSGSVASSVTCTTTTTTFLHATVVTGSGGAVSVVNASSSSSSTTTLTNGNGAAATTPSATFSGPSNASLSVALCRSFVLKYIYLTYLVILQIFVVPVAAVQKFVRRFSKSKREEPSEGGVDVGTASEGFVRQYGHQHGTNSRGVSTGSHHNSARPQQQQQQDGTYRLRRSNRFNSRSDLEEIAQSATLEPTTETDEGGARSGSSSALTTTSVGRNSGVGSRPVSLAAGYGTDSMAEEGSDYAAARRHFNARMRVPRAHGHDMVTKKKTLVLDLDETLIHATSRGSRSQGYMVEVLADGHSCLYYVYKRPHVDYFLQKVSEWYKLVIYTASMAEYADPVIDWLDQNRTLIQRRYFRQSCIISNNGSPSPTYLKDLTVVERDLSSVCLVDNSPVSYSLNRENGIPISTWIDNPDDEALLDLLPFLDALRFTKDVRSVLALRT
ncbi:Nuclear envelope morphology protein 1, partial [Mortierella sp. NVP85]